MYQSVIHAVRICVVSFSMCLVALVTQAAGVPNQALEADIRWTSYGIPHIKAEHELGLGYGIGYVYARDNACLLADEIITVRGERSLYFGATGESSAQINNLTSDFFFTWLNNSAALELFWLSQTQAIQDLLTGYVEGFNLYLTEATTQSLSCIGEAWLQPISTDDLVRLTRRLLVEGGLGQFVESIVAAEPEESWWEWIFSKATTSEVNSYEQIVQEKWHEELQFGYGSNAVAIGSKRSANGKGMLLANPHFPWNGGLRMYQMHLTIPGQLDVMGAALPGLPLINIGFNQHVAWSHTVDSSSHFTLYRLELDPDDITRYLVDDVSLALQKKTLQVQVRDDNGDVSIVTHDLYESEFGPMVIWPGLLGWNEEEAFALLDANVNNTRVLEQWYGINQVEDVLGLQESVEKTQGIPWVNTLAADDTGQVLYMNQSVVPYFQEEQLINCVIPELAAEGLPGFLGHRSACEWSINESTLQAGIVPSQHLPSLLRDDFVQHSNDSAWLVNPDSPIEGYSPLVSREGEELGLRARFALSRLQGSDLLTVDFLQSMVTDNQVYLADLLLSDLLELCVQLEGEGESLSRACSSLASWDKHANINSGLGFVYFTFVLHYFEELDNGWRIPFDAQNPLLTPSGISLGDAGVVSTIKQALIAADETLMAWSVPDNALWGSLQVASRGDEKIAIPGGEGDLGVYNVIESQPQEGSLEVVRGSSYIQLVSYTEEGPQALGLLTYSQSSDSLSPHYSDQTKLFSRQVWPVLPFTDAQIEDDANLERMELRGP